LPNLLDDYKKGTVKEITELPKPKEITEDIKRWPAPLEFQKNLDMEQIDEKFVSKMKFACLESVVLCFFLIIGKHKHSS
jgi:hypothetical protein